MNGDLKMDLKAPEECYENYVEDKFKAMDINGDGGVTLAEWTSYHTMKMAFEKQLEEEEKAKAK